jgi:multidrug efflux pump subunit AcrA (membrane-fusion protein)
MPAVALEFAHVNRRNSGFTPLTGASTPVVPNRSAVDLSSAKETRRKSSWRPFLGTAVVAVTVLTAAYESWKSHSATASVANETVDTARTVTIDRPSPVATATVALPSTIRPWQTATLYARVSGYLSAWRRDLGAEVRAGELLAEIDTPELDQETAQGEALVREAAAAVVQARAERVEAEAELKVAEAQLGRIQAETELAKSQLVRREKLLSSRFVSQEEFETSQRQVEARTADIAAAESDIVRRRTNLATRAAIIDAREATASSRQSNVERLKELQRFKRIVAPFDGVVTRRTAEIGMLVTAGKEALFVVEDMSRVRVQVNVPQTYAVQTSPGVEAGITLPESSMPAVRATITRVADSVEAASRTMLAEIELDNAAHHFQPGSYAQVSLATGQDGSGWTIPTNTLSMRIAGPHVALVNDRNEVEVRRVRLGRDLGHRVVVLDGIRGDERLIVNPGDDLRDGVRIRFEAREPAREIARK